MQETRERIIDALYRIAQTVQTAGDLPELLKTIMQESKGLIETEASSLFLYDPEKNDLFFEVVVGEGEDSHAIKQIRVPMGQGFVGISASQRETIVVNDVASDPRHFTKVDAKSGFVTRNLIAVPMIRQDRLIGVLEVLNKIGGGPFDDMDVKILEIMGEQAAAAIENARLIQANIQAERLAALGTTAANLAHYIKNLVQQFKGSASLIDMGLKNENLKMVSQAWPITQRATDKVSKLVQDMLTISRERKPELQPLSLNDMIRDILASSEATAQKYKVRLTAKLDDMLPLAQLEPTRIHDSILNLVGNGVEALGENGIENGEVIVTTRYEPQSSWITITVEDNGPGMPPEIQARVFEPFFSTKGSRGTGLGLAVVRKTIEEHGGKIALESVVGQGTKFTIGLPFVGIE